MPHVVPAHLRRAVDQVTVPVLILADLLTQPMSEGARCHPDPVRP